MPTTSPPISVTVKRGITVREMIRNLKPKTATHVTPQVHTFEILQPLENPVLLAEGLVVVLTFGNKCTVVPSIAYCGGDFESTPHE